MGIGRTLAGDERQDFFGIELYGFAGDEILGREDHRFFGKLDFVLGIHEDLQDPLGNIPHIGSTFLHIRVVHGGEHGGKLGSGFRHGVFHIHAFFLDNADDRVGKIQILEHHLVDVENHGAGLPTVGRALSYSS